MYYTHVCFKVGVFQILFLLEILLQLKDSHLELRKRRLEHVLWLLLGYSILVKQLLDMQCLVVIKSLLLEWEPMEDLLM